MGNEKRNPHYSTADFYGIEGSPRQVFNFNPGWRFTKGDSQGAQYEYYDDREWEAAALPHGLEITGENASGMRNYQGAAWYRKRFTLPESMKNKRVVVYFEAVMGKSEVWLNGKRIAQHFGGYLPFAADITELIHLDGRDNLIAVRADNANDPTYAPGKEQDHLDFSYLGGIYRNVYLIETESLHVTHSLLSQTTAGGGVFVGVQDVVDKNANIEVRTEVLNESDRLHTFTLRTVLETMEGAELLIQEEAAELQPGEVRQFTQQLLANDVHLWEPNDPYLHFIRTEVVTDGRVVDSFRTRFGIRLFEMRGDEGFFVNKQYIGYKLSGVNRHQDYAYVGNALPNSGQWRDAVLLREGGSNVVRAAHYPLAPSFMDACDELGLLVTVANPGWQFHNHVDAIFEQRVIEDTRDMVRRDRNRPAVLLWETALNETDDQPISMLQEMHRVVHEEFPFPGAFTCADVDHAKLAGFDFYYHGSMEDEKCSLTREYGDGGEVDNFYSQNAMTRVKREWGEQAMLNQAMVRARDLNEIYGTPPKRIGATVWCGIDHQRGYHPDPFLGGVLDVYRLPRYSYFLFKSQYDANFKLNGISTGPMVYITHEISQVSGSDVVLFTNCEEVRLTWLGQVIGTQKPKQGYDQVPHPPVIFRNVFDYHEISSKWRNRTKEIEMVAEGLINGQVVCRQIKSYAERLTGIRLELDDQGIDLQADGSDFVAVRAVLIDNKGVTKVLNSEYIQFEVEGCGEIISGDTPGANPMKTQFGVATAFIRATTEAGEIRVTASSYGLEPAQIVIHSVKSELPILFDPGYAESEQATSSGVQKIKAADQPIAPVKPEEISKLEAEVKRLQLELISKEQDIMELRGTRR
ncbi:sugar-binding domain-containing protein [Paenibacillus qinlingensis]|uniref:Beta-galactosidase n=1 Tax=Paenibacillus qinlingensis TaxID=1837343 RepID=A0ABU1NNR3_9BACL|nr:sugar-binding domain-containing protein [Paenibacillus qinlingensis]MDR6549121.1 beta-galactosidase [Paenibacillus qinlingensis]